MPTYFYHSFPRSKNRRVGLATLRSILKNGLLITTEFKRIPGCEDLPAKRFIQSRVCFTALTPDQVPKHAKKFGAFSLEFKGKTLREFGALPALYLSGRLPNGRILSDGGDEIARHLLSTHDVLRRLWKMHDDGTRSQRKLARAVLRRIKPEKKVIQEFFFTLQTLLNLYYPTDDPKWTGPLGYYEQREWRITPNLVYETTWHYPGPSRKQIKELYSLNRQFFGKKIRGKTRAQRSYYLTNIAGRNIIASARRIIVPDSAVEKAKAIMRESGHKIRVVGISSL